MLQKFESLCAYSVKDIRWTLNTLHIGLLLVQASKEYIKPYSDASFAVKAELERYP
jgi:hypothetical protein